MALFQHIITCQSVLLPARNTEQSEKWRTVGVGQLLSDRFLQSLQRFYLYKKSSVSSAAGEDGGSSGAAGDAAGGTSSEESSSSAADGAEGETSGEESSSTQESGRGSDIPSTIFTG